MRPALRALLGVCMVAGASGSLASQDIPRNSRLVIIPDTVQRRIGSGSVATVRVAVQELAGVAQSFVVHTTLPEGWRLISQPVTTPIPAKGRAFRLVQFQVPADAEAGEYAIVHAVRAPGLDMDLETRTSVLVPVRRSLSVALVDEPVFAAGGSKFHTSFVVTNKGNALTKVRLRVRTDPGISATPDTISELKSGETRIVGVEVEAGHPTDGEEVMRHVALIAEADGGGPLDDGPAKPAAAAVRVVPRSSSADAPWFALPAMLRLNRTQGLGSTSHSFELAGQGSLADGSNTTVDFLARGRQPAHSFFSERDEYQLGITSRAFSFRLGDQAFRLSPLTDGGSISSGLSFSGLRGNWSAGVQAGRDRRTTLASSERSAFVKFDPTPTLSISANALEADRGGRSGTLGSLYIRAMPSAHSFLEVERSLGAAGDGSGASATMMRVAGDQGWIAFDARAIQTDSGYLTQRAGTRALGSVTLRPSSWLRLVERTYVEPARQTSEFTVDVTRRLAAGLRSSSQSSDPMVGGAPTRFGLGVERSAWVRIVATAGRLNATATFERGTMDRRNETPAVPFTSNRIEAGLRVTRRMSIGAFIERTTGQRIYMINPATVVMTGADASLDIGAFSLTVIGNAAPASRFRIVPDSLLMLPGSTAAVDGEAAYKFSNGRSISLRVHTTAAGAGRPAMTVARIGYQLPLQLPIGRSRNVSRVMGRVYDGETGAGVPNALVHLGDRLALTDDDGRVAFGGLLPNRYPVRVDLGAREAGGEGLQDHSLQVDALAGRTTDMGIRVTRLGRIAGTVSLFERTVARSLNAPDSARVRRTGGLGAAVITLVNGSEERHVLTRPDGSFELRDARPGVWRVVMSTDEVPKEHVLDGDSVRVVDLAPGGTQQVELRIVPRARKILPLDAPPSASQPAPPMPKSVAPAREPIVTPAITKPEKIAVPAAIAPIVVVARRPREKRISTPRVQAPAASVAPKRTIDVSASAWPFVGRTSASSSCPFGGAVLPALATCRP